MNPQPEDYDDALENLRNAPYGSMISLTAIHFSASLPRAAVCDVSVRGKTLWLITGSEHLFTPEELLEAWTYEALR